ncbi:hypothetical protein D3C77_358090 [compost metagenome]
MNSETQLIVMAHVQFTARHFLAYRGPLEKLIELIRYSIGEAAPAPEQISNFLRREETQRTLETEWEVSLWRSSDRSNSWRLISLAFNADLEVCKRRINKRPPSSDCCAYCWQDERGFIDALKPELDVYGNAIGGIYLHRACSRPWGQMRHIAERG